MKILILFFTAVLTFSILSLTASASVDNRLTDKAATGSLKGLQRAFAKLNKVDGADAEDLYIAIGKSISANPRNFLRSLKRYRSKVVDLSSLVGSLGEKFVDDFPAQKAEKIKRLEALRSVKDKSLRKTADDCMKLLEMQIAALEKAA